VGFPTDARCAKWKSIPKRRRRSRARRSGRRRRSAINPLILHGQTHGGIAQGIGQALLEECRYDPESGSCCRFLHGLRDARADCFPEFDAALTNALDDASLGIRAGAKAAPRPR